MSLPYLNSFFFQEAMGRDVYVSVLFIINCLGLVYVLFVRYVLLFMHELNAFALRNKRYRAMLTHASK